MSWTFSFPHAHTNAQVKVKGPACTKEHTDIKL